MAFPAVEQPPRGGLPKRSGTLDFPDSYARRMEAFKGNLIRQGSSEMQAWKSFQEIETIIGYLDGNWWGNAPPYRSSFYDSYLSDQRREALASLSDLRPALDISSSVEAYKKQAETSHKYIRHLWNSQNLDIEIVTWVDHALFGTGFIKNVARENDFMFSAHGPDTVMPVQCNGNLQQSAAVIYKNYKPIGYFQNSFGAEKCIGLERQSVRLAQNLGQDRYNRPNGIPEYTWNALGPGFKRRLAMRNTPIRQADMSFTPFPIIELTEIYFDDWSINETGHDIWVHHPDLGADEHNYHYIVPPGCRLYPRKRLIVYAGERVMYDGPSPFWHGLFPFSMLQLNPAVWTPGGISKYHDLIPLCRSINMVGRGVDEAVMRALVGTWIAKRGAIPEDVWAAFIPGKPGQKVLLNPIANINEFKEMQAPALPPQVAEWLKYLVDTIKRRSGSLDIQGLSRKKQAPGGEAIEQMRDSMSSPFRLEGRYLEAALEDVGVQTLSNIFQFATMEQRLRVLGADGITWEDFDYDPGIMKPAGTPPEDHWRKFALKIAPGSSHGASRMQKKVEALTMYQIGALSMEGLYEQTDFPANAQIEQQRLQKEHELGLGAHGKAPRQTRGQRQGKPA
jgi:hypothetical protein